MFVEPVTVAANCWVAPVSKIVEVGLIETATGALTVTVAEADLVGSATLVAVTVYVPGVPGAVYKPELDTVPLVANHVTAVFVEPVTVAVNCWVPLVKIVDAVGLSDIATGTVTVTLADANLVGSATLVAVTV